MNEASGGPERENTVKTVAVIAPDKASGGDFAKTLLEKLSGENFSVAIYYCKISPRVWTDESGKGSLAIDTTKVSGELAQAIMKVIGDIGTGKNITIACNTLSLREVFIDQTITLLEEKGLKNGVDFHLLTTIEAIKKTYKDQSPIILGTKVLSGQLPKEGLPTLMSQNLEDLADLSQEIIWRVKAVKSSDVATAPKIDGLADPETLKERVGTFADNLKSAGIKEVILGCTELPIAFKEYLPNPTDLILIDPAEIVAERLIKKGA